MMRTIRGWVIMLSRPWSVTRGFSVDSVLGSGAGAGAVTSSAQVRLSKTDFIGSGIQDSSVDKTRRILTGIGIGLKPDLWWPRIIRHAYQARFSLRQSRALFSAGAR